MTETAGNDEELFTAIAGEKKYLLLKADTGSGEGEVVYQPWNGEVSDLMLADLCADWAGEGYSATATEGGGVADGIGNQKYGEWPNLPLRSRLLN